VGYNTVKDKGYMGKYTPKYPRGQCAHIYKAYGIGAKKGEQCQRYGRMSDDGQFRCRYHRGNYYDYLKKKNERRLSIKIKVMSAKLNELIKESRVLSLEQVQRHEDSC